MFLQLLESPWNSGRFTEWYDDMVGSALGRVATSAKLMTAVMPKAVSGHPAVGDTFTLARIERDREVATTRYRRDRDVGALEAAMKRLDTEEWEVRERPGYRDARKRASLSVEPVGLVAGHRG